MFERYTERARRVIFFARYEASQFGSREIDVPHLLLGLLREDAALFCHTSPALGVESWRDSVSGLIQQNEPIPTSTDLPLGVGGKRVLELATEEANCQLEERIDTAHLLVGLIRLRGNATSDLLKRQGIAPDRVYQIAKKLATTVGSASSQRRTVDVHGGQLNVDYIRYVVKEFRQVYWNWRRQAWAPSDIVVNPADGRISFDLTLSGPPSHFILVKGGWKQDLCCICRWPLTDSENEEHRMGYTNGKDWLCTACYEKFLANRDFSAYE